ncbi:MAG TPA: hypothetical protein PKE39_16275 [Ignavibacteria bacterium]|nr:hypothetical protein [Ignavibacteria bacterium]HMR00581.1 hypothetical protein [Ignavibacteria bacterium]
MIKSKAIELIKTFSEDEFRQFGLFTESPYFNREVIQVKFYQLLKKNYPKFEAKSFTKEKVFEKLYPGKDYNDGVMRNILSKLLELSQEFIALHNYRKKKIPYYTDLLNELSIRDTNTLFDKAEKEAWILLDNVQIKDDHYFRNLYYLKNIKLNRIRNQKSTLYLPEEIHKESSDALIKSFLIAVLKNQISLANSNQKMFLLEEDEMLKNLELYTESALNKYNDSVYLKYCYCSFQLALTREEKYYFELKKILNSFFTELHERDIKDIFTILTNFCYYKINSGNTEYRKEHFYLFKENIELGHYKGFRRFLEHIKYLNVTVTGLEAGETQWVKEFIEKYKQELDEQNRENAYNFCRALLFYNQKEYGNALTEASKVKTDDLSYKHQLKSLYMKIYFDMNETEPFYSHIDSYRHFLINEKRIPEQTKKNISSYITFTKKLYDLKNRLREIYKKDETEFNLSKLKQEITDSKNLINRQWLLEKASKL